MIRTIRSFPTILRIGVSEAIAYRADFFLWMLTMTMPLVSIALWTAVAEEGAIGGYTANRFTNYFLIVLVIRQVTGSWVNWSMGMEIRSGTLSMRLLRPIHPLVLYAGEGLAGVPLRFFFSLPVAIVALFFIEDTSSNYAISVPILLLSLVGAWLITFATAICVGTLTFWMESQSGPFLLWQGVFAVLSGYLFPVSLLPGWAQSLSLWFPFYYSLGFPVEISLGQLEPSLQLTRLAIQWGFGLVLTGAAIGMFRMGVKRFEAFGA